MWAAARDPRSFFFLWACGEKVGWPVDRWSSLPTGCCGEPIHSASSSVGWQHSRSFALPLHHRWFLTRKQKVSDMYFTPGLMKSSDDENGVKLKLTCGAVMDEENLYFDMFDLYIDCTETFIKGCDLLTKPKTEDHRAMLLVQSHWGEGDQLSRGPVYLEEYFGRVEDAAIMTKMSPIYIDKDVGELHWNSETAFATNVGFLCLYAFVHAFLFLVFSWLGLQISLVL